MTPSEYGKGMLYVTVITLFFYTINFGMDQAFSRFYYERKTTTDRVQLLYQCIFVVSICYFVVTILLIKPYGPILIYFFEESDLRLFMLIVSGAGFFTLNRFVLLAIRMQQRAILYSVGSTLTSLVYLVAVIGIYYFSDNENFELIVYGKLVSLGFVSLALLLLDRDSWNIGSLSIVRTSSRHMKELLEYGWPFFFAFVLTWGIQSIDRVLLLKFSNFQELGIYTAAFSLAAPVVMIQSIFTTFWNPMMTKHLVETPEASKHFFSHTFSIMLFVMSMMFLVALASKPYLLLVLDSRYSGAGTVFAWILFMPVFYLLSEISMAGIVKSKVSIWNTVIALIVLLANILISVLLIPKYGAIGASIALASSYFLFFLLRTTVGIYYYRYNLPILSILATFLLLVVSIFTNQYFGFWGAFLPGILLFLLHRKLLIEVKKKFLLARKLA